MPENTLTITDNRTGQKYDVPIENGTIRAMDLRKIKTGPEDFGLMTYDPAFLNTASCDCTTPPQIIVDVLNDGFEIVEFDFCKGRITVLAKASGLSQPTVE